MKHKKSNWELVVDYLDKTTYLELETTVIEDLNKFRKLNGYISKLNNSISRDEKIIRKLQKEVKERREKLRIHKLNGKPIYERLEYLKKQHDIDVYYTEGVQKKIKNREGENKRLQKKTAEVIYGQVNLKYKSKFLTKSKTIYLKSSRNELLKDLKEVCPVWYEEVGVKLKKGEGVRIEKVRLEIVNVFKPVIEKIIKENSIELNEGKMTITYKTLIENLK